MPLFAFPMGPKLLAFNCGSMPATRPAIEAVGNAVRDLRFLFSV